MNRGIVRKSFLVLFGLFFLAAVYPIAMYLRQPGNEPPGDTMMLSLYFAMGVFLLLAARNPSAHRSLIAYAGWANVAHAVVMALMAVHPASDRKGLLSGVALAGFIGVVLIALVPAKESAALSSSAAQLSR